MKAVDKMLSQANDRAMVCDTHRLALCDGVSRHEIPGQTGAGASLNGGMHCQHADGVRVLSRAGVAVLQPRILPLELSSERWWAFGAAVVFMPVSVGGQMTVFETCCMLLYGYLLAWQWPQTNEVLGMLLMPGGVTWVLRAEQHVSGPRQIVQGVPVAGPEK